MDTVRDIKQSSRETNEDVSSLRTELGTYYLSTENRFSEVRTELAKLKIKAGLWGTMGASIPAAAMIIAQVLGIGRP